MPLVPASVRGKRQPCNARLTACDQCVKRATDALVPASVPASVLASVLVQFGSLGWLLVAAVVDYLFLSLSNSFMHVFFS